VATKKKKTGKKAVAKKRAPSAARAPAVRKVRARATAPSDPLVGKKAPSLALAGGSAPAGQAFALYFYPKDDTPGCTREACDFRDLMPTLRRAKLHVIGVSPDGAGSHERFRSKYSLPFPLLSDGEKALARAFGVWVKKKNYGREYMGIERSTFLIDAKGVVRRAWRGVKVAGHAEEVLAAAREL
jgi:peroxiredoxin Q/BCP